MSPERKSPEVFVSGHSQPAKQLAASQGTCWARVIDTAEILAADVALMREQGIEVCLKLGIICRPTREQAIDVISQILSYVRDDATAPCQPTRDDSQMYREAETLSNEHWRSDLIWTGFVPYRGPVWTTLVGTPTQLADTFIEYKRIGVTQFIIFGWPEVDEVKIFGQLMLPLMRAAEEAENGSTPISMSREE